MRQTIMINKTTQIVNIERGKQAPVFCRIKQSQRLVRTDKCYLLYMSGRIQTVPPRFLSQMGVRDTGTEKNCRQQRTYSKHHLPHIESIYPFANLRKIVEYPTDKIHNEKINVIKITE